MDMAFAKAKSGLYVPSPGGLPGFQRQRMDQTKKPTGGWNPIDAGPHIQVFNGNQSAKGGPGTVAWESARGLTSHATGLWYFELLAVAAGIAVSGGTASLVGLANGAMSLAEYTGQTPANSVGVQDSGAGWFGTAGSATAWSSGQVIGFAVDATNRLIYQRVGNATLFNGGTGDAGAGTGGVAYTISGAVFIAAAFGPNHQYDVNIGQSAFVGALPRGYTPWGG